MQKLNIGRQGISREVIHVFIKADVAGNFDAASFRIVPKNVVGGWGVENQGRNLSWNWGAVWQCGNLGDGPKHSK